jgi:Cdc6-like AAA superfamily ATPase
MRILQEAYRKGIPPEHLNLEVEGAEEAYREMLGEVEEKGSSKIKLPPGSTFSLQFSPNPEKRFIYYIAGASGSGKSYIAKHLAEQYQHHFKGRPVYLVSKLKEDETLDGMTERPLRLSIDKLVEKPMPDLEALRESLVIFDDYDTLTGKEAKAVQQLIDDICIMGRHTVTSILILSHHLSNFKKTRLCLTEATHFVVYPQSTGAHALNYFLKTYVGMGPKEVQAIKNTGSRWLCIHKNFPIYYITETEAGLLNQD